VLARQVVCGGDEPVDDGFAHQEGLDDRPERRANLQQEISITVVERR
jgi:hypothetical protein